MRERGKSLLYLARLFLVLLVVAGGHLVWSVYSGRPAVVYRVSGADVTMPAVRLRSGGWMDSIQVRVYIERPLFNRRILRLSGGLPRGLHDIDPPAIEAQTIPATPSKKSPYGILWSADGHRVACTYYGWLIGAHDVKSGQSIQPLRSNQEVAIQAHLDIDSFLRGD